jgi:LPXTG-motif cell wall-anchored protein
MTFLPKTDESLNGILSVLIALPLSLAGTMFIFYLTNFG